jgi:hypothetical protein
VKELTARTHGTDAIAETVSSKRGPDKKWNSRIPSMKDGAARTGADQCPLAAGLKLATNAMIATIAALTRTASKLLR